MLPSITSGPFGIATKPIYGSNGVHGIKIVNKIDAKDDEAAQSRNCPSLPLISEGSFTSLVSRRSEKSEKSLEEGQERGNRGNEEIVSRVDIQRSTGLKTKQLQLDCEWKNVDRGWCPQGLNPRFANSSRPSQFPTMGLHMMSTSQRLLLQQSLGQPVESLHNRRNQTTVVKKEYLTTLAGQTQINKRYRVPAVSSGGFFPPSKEVSTAISSCSQAVPSPSHPQKAVASKLEGIAVHSRCCCRRHKQQDTEQRTTLKSRSSESFGKERMFKERKEGTSNEKKVKPSDRPPPKKQPKVSGDYLQPKRKSNRINVLASESDSSLLEQRKRIKKATPKVAEQKRSKSLLQKVQDIASREQVSITDSPTKEKPDEVMIYIENVSESLPVDDEKEVMDGMEVEYIDERELQDQSNRVDVISVTSLRTVTASDAPRSTTPRLLKVSSEQQADLSSLSQVFRKLDTDCDGHISFNELKKSLPPHLTRHQINYLKKIYNMACESTYFGLEEFTATHQMCDLLEKSSLMVSNAFSNLDSSSMDFWLSTFMESFSKEDKNQSGIIDMQSFQNMLASIINVHPDSLIIEKILRNLGKSKYDSISGVELLAYIPYFVAAAPKDN